MSEAEMLAYCDLLSKRINAMRVNAQASFRHPNWVMYSDPPNVWGPPHPSEASVMDRLAPGLVGLAIATGSGAAAIVLALSIVSHQ